MHSLYKCILWIDVFRYFRDFFSNKCVLPFVMYCTVHTVCVPLHLNSSISSITSRSVGLQECQTYTHAWMYSPVVSHRGGTGVGPLTLSLIWTEPQAPVDAVWPSGAVACQLVALGPFTSPRARGWIRPQKWLWMCDWLRHTHTHTLDCLHLVQKRSGNLADDFTFWGDVTIHVGVWFMFLLIQLIYIPIN